MQLLAFRSTTLATLTWALLLALVFASGCSQWQRRKFEVPANCKPPHLFDAPRSSRRPLNYTHLQKRQPKDYRLGADDVLGIYIAGVLGEPDRAPPVLATEQRDLPPALGYPVTIREDGTVSLPEVRPIHVAGMTLKQAEEAIRHAYTVEKQILVPGNDRILVSLVQLRTYHVLVIREDLGSNQSSSSARARRPDEVVLEPQKRGRAFTLELPAYRNDVLHALTESGGLPGADAKAQVTILRAEAPPESIPSRFERALGKSLTSAYEHDAVVQTEYTNDSSFDDYYGGISQANYELDREPARLNEHGLEPLDPPVEVLGAAPLAQLPYIPDDTIGDANPFITTIPLQFGPDMPAVEISEEMIELRDGDIVLVESRESEIYYTGGLLQGGVHPIPRDYDLDVLGAIAAAGGSIAAGVGGSGNVRLGGAVGTVFPPTKVTVIRTVNGRQVPIHVDLKRAIVDPCERILIQPNDFVVLEYTQFEAVANLVINNVAFSFNGGLFSVQ